MNWNKDRSVELTRICVLIVMALLLAADIGCYWLTGWYVHLREMYWQQGVGMMVVIYIGSVFAWILLCKLYGLISEIERGNIFTAENVSRLRKVSWCCVWGCIVSLAGTAVYFPFVFVAAAAGFMALIVRVVKNCFQHAVEMKTELDLTV